MAARQDKQLAEIGRKTVTIVDEFLDLLGDVVERSRQTSAHAHDGQEQVLSSLKERIEALEARVFAGGSGKRPSRNERGAERGQADRRPGRGRERAQAQRLPREVSREEALKAARQLQKEGKPVTLASVARLAGLKYSQVVYAFGRREQLLQEMGQ